MRTYRDRLHGGHSVEVIWMLPHTHDLRHNLHLRPINAKDVRQFLEVNGCRFAYTKDRIAQPRHAQVSELFIEERLAELCCEKGDILYDSLSDAP